MVAFDEETELQKKKLGVLQVHLEAHIQINQIISRDIDRCVSLPIYIQKLI